MCRPLNLIAFKIGFADGPASGGPAFLAPVNREVVADQHLLYARIAQHGVSGGFATVKISEVVGLQDGAASSNVCVVAIDVLSGDKVIAGLIPWRVRKRCARRWLVGPWL